VRKKINLYNTYPDIVTELRNILLSTVESDDYVTPQDSSMHESSLPNKFGGVWYPFEEKYSN